MFRAEWRRPRGNRDLGRLAVVADGRRPLYEGGDLRFESQTVDMVYNRLADFAMGLLEHAHSWPPIGTARSS